MITWQLFSHSFIHPGKHMHCLGVRATDGFYPQWCHLAPQARGVTRERPWPVCPFVCPSVCPVSAPRWQRAARRVSGPCWFSGVRNIADHCCWMAPAPLSAPAGLSLNPGCSLSSLIAHRGSWRWHQKQITINTCKPLLQQQMRRS